MRLREWRYEDGAFSYGQRIAVTQTFQQEGLSDYGKMKQAWRELYGWSARLMPPRLRAKAFGRMMQGMAYWAKLEQTELHYEPTDEERRAGITDYTQAVGDMGTIKAMAKAYAQDPDAVLGWQWAKVFGILRADLEEFRFSERLRKVYERKH